MKINAKDERIKKHIQKGGRAFLPQWRMREIRWEEAVAYSQIKRSGSKDDYVSHTDCSCGFITCQGVPTILRSN